MTGSPESTGALSGVLARLAEAHTDMEIVFSLRMAEAGLMALSRPWPSVATVAVVGPTQTGKSTVVNILAGGDYVDTSPLAAHTQRASVLAVNGAAGTDRLQSAAAAGLPVEPRSVANSGPACLIWDTPDFDSSASAVYRQQSARVCALADLIVVVVSKEKYADQSVWRVLETIAPLEVPTVVCLNKSGDDADAGILLKAIRRRLSSNPRVATDTPVLRLPMLPAGGAAAALERQDVQAFRGRVLEQLEPRAAGARRAGLARLIRANWDTWVEPVEQELACQREWLELINNLTRAFLARYRSQYIDHARHHDVAQKAIIGLLELLEVPALAGPLSRTRRALTWPFRRLAGRLGRPVEAPRDKELEVLDGAIDHYLLSIRGELARRRHPWWRALETELAESEPRLRQCFRTSVEQYREAFQPRIDDLSEQLYEQLKRNPATLNALRATRLGADAGGILVAFKTGTLGLYDALFAPAVISLTSYLTESAVGRYLNSVIAGLKREQYETVRTIIRDDVENPLKSLHPRGAGLVGVTAGELARARRSLEGLAS